MRNLYRLILFSLILAQVFIIINGNIIFELLANKDPPQNFREILRRIKEGADDPNFEIKTKYEHRIPDLNVKPKFSVEFRQFIDVIENDVTTTQRTEITELEKLRKECHKRKGFKFIGKKCRKTFP